MYAYAVLILGFHLFPNQIRKKATPVPSEETNYESLIIN